MTLRESCPACDLLAFWRAYIEWDDEHAALWEGHPDDDESEPEGSEALYARRPRHPEAWADSVFEYDYRTLRTILPMLRCQAHV